MQRKMLGFLITGEYNLCCHKPLNRAPAPTLFWGFLLESGFPWFSLWCSALFCQEEDHICPYRQEMVLVTWSLCCIIHPNMSIPALTNTGECCMYMVVVGWVWFKIKLSVGKATFKVSLGLYDLGPMVLKIQELICLSFFAFKSWLTFPQSRSQYSVWVEWDYGDRAGACLPSLFLWLHPSWTYSLLPCSLLVLTAACGEGVKRLRAW